MDENVDNSNAAAVISIATTYGENIIGFLVGYSKSKLTDEDTVILYRPIKINYVEYTNNGTLYTNYVHELFFPFGGTAVEIPKKDIRIIGISSPFFTAYYSKILGEKLVGESALQDGIISHYEKREIDELMDGKDAIYVKFTSEFLQ